MAGTLKDIVNQGAAPPEAFGFGRGDKSAPRVSPKPADIGGSGRNATPDLDGRPRRSKGA